MHSFYLVSAWLAVKSRFFLSTRLNASRAGPHSNPACIHTAWPSLSRERDCHMLRFIRRLHVCRENGLIVQAATPADIPAAAGPYGHLLRGSFGATPHEARHTANALTHLRMLNAVVKDSKIHDDDYALILENDVDLNPQSLAMDANELTRVVRWAIHAARGRGIPMVHFGHCPFEQMLEGAHVPRTYACENAHIAPITSHPAWPSLRTCVGDMRCAQAYAISKRRSRAILAAFDARRKSKKIPATTCARYIWGGRYCPRDPWQLYKYLRHCKRNSSKPDELPCRSLIVGAELVVKRAHAGLFIQARDALRSTLDPARSHDGRLSLATTSELALRARLLSITGTAVLPSRVRQLLCPMSAPLSNDIKQPLRRGATPSIATGLQPRKYFGV